MKAGEKETAPLFSVIMLSYMQRHLLDDCLASIFMQTYPNIELVICDDWSADFDAAEVENHIREKKPENIRNVVVYRQDKNIGLVRNAQKGVELSSGKFFKLHAADDMLYSADVISKMSERLRQSGVEIVAARAAACDVDGVLLGTNYPEIGMFREIGNADAAKQFELLSTEPNCEYIGSSSVFWKRQVYDEIGGFDLRCRDALDWPTWLRITGSGHRISTDESITTIYRLGGLNNNDNPLDVEWRKRGALECAEILREDALPRLREAGRKIKALRCEHSIRCIENHCEVEGHWEYWGFFRQLGWRLKNINFLFVAWLYHVRKKGKQNISYLLLSGFAICSLLYLFHDILVPGVFSAAIWAWASLVLLALFLIQLALSVWMRVMRFLSRLKRGE